MSSAAAESPLGRALGRASFGGMPVEIWVAIANGWSVGGPRISVADAETFARAQPEVVRSFETPDGTRYERLRAEATTVGEMLAIGEAMNPAPSSAERDDAIALELVALLRKPAAGRGVAKYLLRVLPDQCAGGTGKGIEALRAHAGESEVDKPLARALTNRALDLPRDEGADLLREAIALFQALGDHAAVAKTRGVLAAKLESSGDPDAAIVELERLLVEYHALAAENDSYGQFVGVTLLNLGRLYGAAGRRREAKQTTKAALAEFRCDAARDRHALANLSRAMEQLSRLRWRR